MVLGTVVCVVWLFRNSCFFAAAAQPLEALVSSETKASSGWAAALSVLWEALGTDDGPPTCHWAKCYYGWGVSLGSMCLKFSA